MKCQHAAMFNVREYCIQCVTDLEGRVSDLETQNKDAAKLLQEFITNTTVCMALGPTCVGNHQEDPCKCLYCRTKQQLYHMDS